MVFPSWMFFCTHVDLVGNVIAMSIDNEEVKRVRNVDRMNNSSGWPSNNLAILSINYVAGRIGNIKIYGGETNFGQIRCNDTGTFLTREANSFDRGHQFFQPLETVCHVPGESIFIPIFGGNDILYKKADAIDICKKFGNGIVAKVNGDDELQKVMLTYSLSQGSRFSSSSSSVQNDRCWIDGPLEGDCVTCADDSCQQQSCAETACVICQYQEHPQLTLNGLCDLTQMDTKFYPLYVGKFYWVGSSGDVIYQEDGQKPRIWKHGHRFKQSNSVLHLPNNHVVGDNLWTVFLDDKCPETKQTLSLNACDKWEFNCNDGFCIDIENRCDAHADCRDGSDEFDCSLISHVEKNFEYNKEIISGWDKTTKLELSVALNLKQFLDIDENNGFFRVNFELFLTWFDSRLQFLNLKEISASNTLTSEEYMDIWKPKVTFRNSEVWRYELNRGPLVFAIHNNLTQIQYSNADSLKNSLVFTGNSNNLTLAMDVR